MSYKQESRKVNSKISKLSPAEEDVEQIRGAFELFDNGSGKVDPKEIKSTMISLGYDKKNPVIFQLFSDLDTTDNARKGGIDFNNFMESINSKLEDKTSTEGIKRIFGLFKDDPNQDTISLHSVKRIANELGEKANFDELRDMIERISGSSAELTLDEFFDIMTRKSLS
jgi:centrin-1